MKGRFLVSHSWPAVSITEQKEMPRCRSGVVRGKVCSGCNCFCISDNKIQEVQVWGIIFAGLVRCAVWFEITHPEEDYWHRSAMRRDGPEKVSWLKPAGDLEDVQYQSCSQEEVNGQKEEA